MIEFTLRLGVQTSAQQRTPEIDARSEEIRLEPDRLAQALYGLLEILLPMQGRAEVVMGFGQCRRHSQRLSAAVYRAVQLPVLDKSAGQINEHFRAGARRHRLIQPLLRRPVIASRHGNQAKEMQCLGLPRFKFKDPPRRPLRVGEFPAVEMVARRRE